MVETREPCTGAQLRMPWHGRSGGPWNGDLQKLIPHDVAGSGGPTVGTPWGSSTEASSGTAARCD
jgi:hypothetical protein